MESKSKKSTILLISVVVILLVGLGIAIYFINHQKAQIEEIQEENSLDKQQLEDEYQNLSMMYEGYKFNIKNDSLLRQLNNEQAKVQRLLEELKTVKADNKAEIARLNKELASLRKILRSYIAQIDSLNKVTAQLTQEKKEITAKYNEKSKALDEVTQAKENLTEKVSLAAKLDATGISVAATNNKGKVQKKISKAEQLVVNFTITKNITAEPGERTIYVRIMKPDDDVLVKNRSNTFKYENRDVNYSMKRIVEYGGEEVPVTLYWNIEEYLMAGTYRVDIFADGSRIGSRSFTLND